MSTRRRYLLTVCLLMPLTAWGELRGVPYQGVPVGTIKRHATGSGNAPKQAMIAEQT